MKMADIYRRKPNFVTVDVRKLYAGRIFILDKDEYQIIYYTYPICFKCHTNRNVKCQKLCYLRNISIYGPTLVYINPII